MQPFTPFGPVIDKSSKNVFIDRPPIEIIISGNVNKAPWVTGVVSEDGLCPVARTNFDKCLLIIINNFTLTKLLFNNII